MKIILLNGPPRSGKDTAGNALIRALSAGRLKFSDAVKDGTHAAYGLIVPTDHFEDVKDTPREEFFGLTPRAAYIHHSEEYMKPLHGKDVFGRIYTRRLRQFETNGLVVTADSGFVEEAMPVLHAVGEENVLLLRVHRNGCSFANDSRNYINLPGVVTHDLINDDLDAYLYEVTGLAWEWLERQLVFQF